MPLGPGTSELTPTIVAPPRVPARTETVAQQFDQRVARIGARDVLLREVEQRLLSRLEFIKLDPRRILDVGCGLGRSRSGLLNLYPQATWTGVELSTTMACAGLAEQQHALGMSRWWRSAPRWVVADGAHLPFGDGSADLLFSNLMLHWHPTPHFVFPEWKRVLQTDGLLMFSCFGPDTLRELRVAAADALPHSRPMPFVDMHDFGDMLVASGFATPVMDVETLTLTFGSPGDLLTEVRSLGANPRSDRWPALPSGRQARRLLDALAARRDAAGRITLTFEIAYGHAWKPRPRTPGRSVISMDALRQHLSGISK
jgi:malonyl-CoA O-methyltransferase